MARKPRIHFPGALYHIITRGNRRQGVFLDEKDLERFVTYLSDCKSRFPFRLYAYALMQNHLHFLIEVGETPLSRIMQFLLPCFRCLTPISLLRDLGLIKAERARVRGKVRVFRAVG